MKILRDWLGQPRPSDRPIVLHTTVMLKGEEIAKYVTRYQQRRLRRNPV